MSKDNTCPNCRGFGAVPKSGYVPKENATHKTCPDCHGSGQQEDKPMCGSCKKNEVPRAGLWCVKCLVGGEPSPGPYKEF